MSVSTDGQICYGVMLEEDYPLPWKMVDDYEGDHEEWWRRVNGFEEIWTPETSEQYFTNCKAFDHEIPIPFTLVNYCSDSFPLYILAVPSSVKFARKGYPEKLSPVLEISREEEQALVQFCQKYEFPVDLHWYLSSYHG